MNLSELKMGQTCVVLSLSENQKYVERFLDFGIFVGKKVRLIKKAPFGDPLLFQVGNVRVGIRREDAKHIEVEK